MQQQIFFAWADGEFGKQSLDNCCSVLLFDTYVANHHSEFQMMNNGPMASVPKVAMIITGPIIGFICGLALGLFAFVASKLMKK